MQNLPWKKFLPVIVIITIVIAVASYYFFSVSDGSKTGESKTEAEKTANFEPLSIISVKGKILIPSGFASISDSFRVRTAVGSSTVSQDGSFEVLGLDGGEHIAMVVGRENNPVLLGFIESSGSDEKISSKSTAEVILFLASGAVFLPYSYWDRAKNIIGDLPETGALAIKLEKIITRNPNAFVSGDNELEVSVVESVSRIANKKSSSLWHLFEEARAEITSIDAGAKSGFRVDPGAFDEIRLVNGFRRIVRAKIYETGYKKGADEVIYDSPKLKKTVDMPSVGKLSDTITALVDAIYEKTPYVEVVSEPFKFVSDAVNPDFVFYRVITLGWGMPGDFSVKISEEEMGELNEIFMQTILQEVAMPLFLSYLSSSKADKFFTKFGKEMVGRMSSFMFSRGPLIRNYLSKGDLSGATTEFFNLITRDPAVQRFIREQYSLNILKLVDMKILSYDDFDNFVYLFANFNKALKTVDIMLKALDASMVTAHFASSHQVEQWNIAVRKPKVALDPSSAEISKNSIQEFKVNVQKGEQNINLTYEWFNKNKKAGELSDELGKKGDFSSTKNKVIYTAHADSGEDIVTVKAYWLNDTGQKSEKIFLGEAQASVKIKKGCDDAIDQNSANLSSDNGEQYLSFAPSRGESMSVSPSISESGNEITFSYTLAGLPQGIKETGTEQTINGIQHLWQGRGYSSVIFWVGPGSPHDIKNESDFKKNTKFNKLGQNQYKKLSDLIERCQIIVVGWSPDNAALKGSLVAAGQAPAIKKNSAGRTWVTQQMVDAYNNLYLRSKPGEWVGMGMNVEFSLGEQAWAKWLPETTYSVTFKINSPSLKDRWLDFIADSSYSNSVKGYKPPGNSGLGRQFFYQKSAKHQGEEIKFPPSK